MNNRSETPSRFRQTTDFNCGAAALCFLLSITVNVASDVDTMTRELGSTEADGTSHEMIEDWLYDNEYVYKSSRHHFLCRVRLPLLVNYYKIDDGHYGVITDLQLKGRVVQLFDPSDGLVHGRSWDWFLKNWYSPRYGKRWGLYNLKKRANLLARHETGA
jgi:predicted double-glycine peptidase